MQAMRGIRGRKFITGLCRVWCLTVVSLWLMANASCIVAFAIDGSVVDYLNEHYQGGTAGNNNCASSVKSYFKTSADGDYTEVVTIGPDTAPVILYYKASDEAAIISAVARQNEANTITDKLSQITDGFNISADVDTATRMMAGLSKPVSAVVGGAVVLATLGLTFFTCCDVLYLTWPVFRNKIREASSDRKKVLFVSEEAVFAAEKAALKDGKNPYLTYLFKRSWAYILTTLMIFILLTGNISLITNIALRMLSGVLELIQGM